jgi:hypothetical protein
MNVRKAMVRLLVSLAVALPAADLTAAEEAGGAWLILSHTGMIGDATDPGPWRYGLQGEFRYFARDPALHQYVLRTGLGFRVNPRVSLWGGYAYFGTDVHGSGSVREHRGWQQLDWDFAVRDRSRLRSRTRLEQRFVDGREETGWWLRQRFLYESLMPRSETLRWLLGVETFHSLRQTPWLDSGLVQWRVMAGIGFRLAGTEVETGYMYQHAEVSGRVDAGNHLLIVSLRL